MPASRFTAAVRSSFLAALARLIFCAAILLTPLCSGQAGAADEVAFARALILLEAPADLGAAAAQIEALGGAVYATFPERALLAWMTAEQAGQARRLPGVAAVALSDEAAQPLSPALAGEDTGARAALLAWNAALPGAKLPETDRNEPATRPERPDDPLQYPPDHAAAQTLDAPADGQELGPDATQTSEFMLGSVQVDVFLPESNGQTDPQSETWTAAQVDQVMAKVAQGVTWWAEAARAQRVHGQPAAPDLVPQIVFHTPFNAPEEVSTQYEPVSRPSWDEGLWIGEVLGRLGYGDASYFSAARRYAHERRTALGRDWAFSIFIVNSAADPDGRFANGYFAYSYLFGPFVVMTSDNDGWGLDSLDIVTAHEMGHIFGALDEYAASGCSKTQTGGYLNVANTNCETGGASQDSIMRSAISQRLAYPRFQVSTPVRGMLGWRDLDADGWYDPLDTHPALRLDPAAASGEPLEVTGAAMDIPWVSLTRRDASINPIVRVEYRLPGGEWQACRAADGRFDALQEAYTCPAAEIIQVRAINRIGSAAIESRGDFPSYKVYLPVAVSFFMGQPE